MWNNSEHHIYLQEVLNSEEVGWRRRGGRLYRLSKTLNSASLNELVEKINKPLIPSSYVFFCYLKNFAVIPFSTVEGQQKAWEDKLGS